MLDPDHPVGEHDEAAYNAACGACEKWIAVTNEEQKSFLKLALLDDSTRKGLVLTKDANCVYPPLLKGDRLEPCSSLPDVWAFAFAELPFTVKFWRIARDRIVVHHRNPIIAMDLGLSTRNFSGDILHGMHLGLFPVWITRSLWLLFSVDAFESRCTRADDHLRYNALVLQTLVSRFYPTYERGLSERARRGVTRVSSITPSSLGKADLSSHVGFKAAECKHFLPFVLGLVREHRGKLVAIPELDYFALEQSGQMLMDFTAIVDSQPRLMSAATANQLVMVIDRHVVLAARAGIKKYPKNHMVSLVLFW